MSLHGPVEDGDVNDSHGENFIYSQSGNKPNPAVWNTSGPHKKLTPEVHPPGTRATKPPPMLASRGFTRQMVLGY